jgi:hypothetical protein
MFFKNSNTTGVLPFQALQEKVGGGGGCGCGLPPKKGILGGNCQCGKKIDPSLVKLSLKAGKLEAGQLEAGQLEAGGRLNLSLDGLSPMQIERFQSVADQLRINNKSLERNVRRSPRLLKKNTVAMSPIKIFPTKSLPRVVCYVENEPFTPFSCSFLTQTQKLYALNAKNEMPGQYKLFQQSITPQQKQSMKQSSMHLGERNKYVKDVGVLWSTAKNCV